MKVRVYRNLDRPFTLFGIKGKFIIIAIAAVVVFLIVSLLVGGISGSTLAGGVCMLLLCAGGYLGITELQNKFGEKGLSRFISRLGLPKFIVVRSKVWKR